MKYYKKTLLVVGYYLYSIGYIPLFYAQNLSYFLPHTNNDWVPTQVKPSNIIILSAGHEAEPTSGAGQDLLIYEDSAHSIESLLTLRALPIVEEALTHIGFTVLTYYTGKFGHNARNSMHAIEGELKDFLHAYALELHFDCPKGKSGIIPGSKYQDSGVSIHPFDEALGKEFGYFSMFYRGPNPRLGITHINGLSAILHGVSIIELDPLQDNLHDMVIQATQTHDFSKVDQYLHVLAQRIAKALKGFIPHLKKCLS